MELNTVCTVPLTGVLAIVYDMRTWVRRKHKKFKISPALNLSSNIKLLVKFRSTIQIY